jgi:hypothetical protein
MLKENRVMNAKWKNRKEMLRYLLTLPRFLLAGCEVMVYLAIWVFGIIMYYYRVLDKSNNDK